MCKTLLFFLNRKYTKYHFLHSSLLFCTNLIKRESIEAVCLRLLEVRISFGTYLLDELLKDFRGPTMSFILVNLVFQDRLKDFHWDEVSQILRPGHHLASLYSGHGAL